MKLVKPTMEYDQAIQQFRQEFLEYEGSMDGCGSLRKFDRTQDRLDQVQLLQNPKTVPAGLVPMTQYIYVREPDQKIIGVIRIRHYLNNFFWKNTAVILATAYAPVNAGRGTPHKCYGLSCQNAGSWALNGFSSSVSREMPEAGV